MGFFITFEGVEGCGKTTQIKILAETLKSQGYSVRLTREPGGSPVADKIRNILLDAENSAITPTTELLLYAASRAQHVAEVINPALERGKIVLCDRYTDATLAYQGFGRSLNMESINALNKMATKGCFPDLTVLLDCAPETGLKRAMDRINSESKADSSSLREERFELESLEFHKRVREGYLKLAETEPKRFLVFNGIDTVSEIAAAIKNSVLLRLAER
ncbi:MAG: dTMP kinase [Desulfuromonadales bacterium]|nr:dTMP kinase [Desulfuromonadales bacterium]